jgi:hypothetical protein
MATDTVVASQGRQAQQSAAESAELPAPIEFPRGLSPEAEAVVVHTAQIDTWKDFETLEARVAIAVSRPVKRNLSMVLPNSRRIRIRTWSGASSPSKTLRLR